MKKLNVVFFGTPDFSVPTLEMLSQDPHVNLVKIISMPPRKQGRGMKELDPPVIQFAKEKKIPFFQTENINREAEEIQRLVDQKIDAFIVLAFAQFLGSKLLALPKLGCFNIHTSILPRFRGAAPIQHAILNGDKSTGVSIQKMVKKMDAGDLCHFHELAIQANETGGSLYTKLKFLSAIATTTFIEKLTRDELQYTAQDESQVTFAPTLSRNDGLLDFNNQDAQQIDQKVRALFPWPGTFTFLNGKRCKVFSVTNSTNKLAPGEVSTQMGTLEVGCATGTVRLNDIQIEGKKKSSDTDYINGIKSSGTAVKIGDH